MKASPPLLVSFGSLEEALEAMPERFRSAIEKGMQTLLQRRLPPALSVGVVATLFGLSPAFVRAMVTRPQRYYRVFEIRKGKKLRRISSPRVGLKLIQSWLGFHLARAVQLPSNVVGFVPGVNGILEAAAVHSGATWVYSLDLRDFFQSVSKDETVQALRTVGYPATAAGFIAELCTLHGSLPQGSPASPVLSNLAFLATDQDLIRIANGVGIKYTRYADDLVFSGAGPVPEGLKEQVHSCLTTRGWEIAPEKEHLASLPARLKVHGLLVHGARPRLTKGYRNRIRAYRHLIAEGRVLEGDRAKIAGHIAFADQVERGIERKR